MNHSLKKDKLNQVSHTRFQYLTMATVVSLFLVIIVGVILRVTGTGLACPDWPTCFGQWTPPLGIAAITNYLHRALTVVATILLLLSTLVAWRKIPKVRMYRWPLLAAVVFLAVEIIIGGLVVRLATPPDMMAFHIAAGLITLGFATIPVVMVYVRKYDLTQADRLLFRSPFSRLSLWAIGSTFLVFISGTVVAGLGSNIECVGWPLCNGSLIADGAIGWVHITHRMLVGLTGLIIAALFIKAWRTQRTQRAILSAATLVTCLFFAQVLVGFFIGIQGYSSTLLGLHAATVASLWVMLVISCVLVGLAARSAEDEKNEASMLVDSKQRARDLAMLTKPIIIALLLVTTYTGMVVGGRQLPSLGLTFWTLLGGFFAAGGSAAVNQYIDRELDQRMTRTAKRPIASGRMNPAEGLAFGLGLLVIAFYIMATLVNLLAALLSLAGMIYYIILYSLLLKKTTVQNIVIGGGAGAIPPLVGWAAATGGLNIPALFLFIIIFLWTPPHFWALALIRKNEYENAGIPMMPVVRGKRATRWHILIYTLELVAVTVLMPIFNLAGSIFFVSAIVLGGGLIYAAWRVWREGGNKLAWRMYRYSSIYLALLFMALMADALL